MQIRLLPRGAGSKTCTQKDITQRASACRTHTHISRTPCYTNSPAPVPQSPTAVQLRQAWLLHNHDQKPAHKGPCWLATDTVSLHTTATSVRLAASGALKDTVWSVGALAAPLPRISSSFAQYPYLYTPHAGPHRTAHMLLLAPLSPSEQNQPTSYAQQQSVLFRPDYPTHSRPTPTHAGAAMVTLLEVPLPALLGRGCAGREGKGSALAGAASINNSTAIQPAPSPTNPKVRPGRQHRPGNCCCWTAAAKARRG